MSLFLAVNEARVHVHCFRVSSLMNGLELEHQLPLFGIADHGSYIQRLVDLEDIHKVRCTIQEHGNQFVKVRLANCVQHKNLSQSEDGL